MFARNTSHALTRRAHALRLRLALVVGAMSPDRQAQALNQASAASLTPAMALLPL